MSHPVPANEPARSRILARLRRSCPAAVLVEMRARTPQRPDRPFVLHELAGWTGFAQGTVREALNLAKAVGLVDAAPVRRGTLGPRVMGYRLTGEGLAFAATIHATNATGGQGGD